MTETKSTQNPLRLGPAAGWAVYLAMSWTWCIGMYLPVMLLRELGIVGVIAFAVPNILGAAAMGWVLRDARQSREMVDGHHEACVWFSLVTIIFHAFFAAWLIRRIVGPNAGLGIAAAFVFFWMILQWRRGGEFLATGLALAITLAVIGWGYWRGELPYIGRHVEGSSLPMINNLWLAPVWLFGLLCCPYLDLTFHTARQAMGRAQARVAFTLGFCVIFAAMILITLGYSGWLIVGFRRAVYPQLALILGTHLIVQSCLTAALHARLIAQSDKRIRIGHFLGFSVFLIIAVLLGVLDRGQFQYNGIRFGEIIYRVFLGFYGLVFPAYVWLRIVSPRRSMLRVAVVVFISAPLYWLAFINELMIFAVPGVLIVVLAKFLPDPQANSG